MAWLRSISIIMILVLIPHGSCLPAKDEERFFTSAISHFASTVLQKSNHYIGDQENSLLKMAESFLNNFLAQATKDVNVFKLAVQGLNQTSSRRRRSVFKLLDNSRRFKPFGLGYSVTYPFLAIRVPTTKLTWSFWTQPCPTAKV